MTSTLTAPIDTSDQVGSVTDDVTNLVGLRHGDQVDRSAGFGQFGTRKHIDGPNSYRFEVTDDGELVATFRSEGEIAMAIYLSGRSVRWDLSTERIAELVVVGIDSNGYRRVADQAARWELCGNLKRHQVCTDLASRLGAVTEHADAFPRFPHWQPDWRHVVR